jgi:hypothetical protein
MNGTRQTMMLALLGLLIAGGAWGQGSYPPNTVAAVNGLQGLREAEVAVEVLKPEGAERTGLTEEGLETTLKAALLRSNTIEVLYSETGGKPFVYLNVLLVPLESGYSTIYSVELQLCDFAFLYRAGVEKPLRVFGARVWQALGRAGIAPDNEVAAQVRQCITEMVDEFTVDWHKANPRDTVPEGE